VSTYQSALLGLADPTRRTIFERLGSGPRAVVDLADGLPVSRPAVSQHLRVLKEAGLVIDRREGNRRIYQLNPAGLGELRAYLDRFWDRALADFKAAAESEEGEGT
jgi:DNA-binding transcriptional ArsR family regulator